MSIVTDAKDEREFLDQMSEAFTELVESGRYDGDWEFQFNFWLPQMVDICCAYRGYKNGVMIRKQFIAGEFYPIQDDSVIVVGLPRKGVGTDVGVQDSSL